MKLPFELNRTYEYSELQELVASMCEQEPIVNFSIFKTNEAKSTKDRDIWFVDAPDVESLDRVIACKVQFVADYWRVADEPVFSHVVVNPTWRDIINIFNDMLQQGDRQGIYLEGLNLLETKDNVKIVKFQIGS